MAGEKALEEQVKILQKQFGGVVKLVKDLKLTVEALGKKLDAKEIDEVKEILDTQKVINEVTVANSDAIQRIDREIKDLVMKKKVVEVQNDALENTTIDVTENSVRKKCRYYNGGYCKRKGECRFVLPE